MGIKEVSLPKTPEGWAINRSNGGEEGIRTLDTLLTHTPLAGERLQPLGHLSTSHHNVAFTYVQSIPL